MPMYTNINGTRKEFVLLYSNINGTKKSINQMYANINGSRKQIFSKYYVWNKYNRISRTTPGTYERQETQFGTITGWNYNPNGAGEYAFYTSESNIRVYDDKYLELRNCSWIRDWEYDNFVSVLSGKTWSVYSSTYSWSGGEWSSTMIYEANELKYGVVSNDPYYWDWDDYSGRLLVKYKYRITSTPVTTYEKGNTNYGLVYSTNRNAYPDNSYSGSYWYVFLS